MTTKASAAKYRTLPDQLWALSWASVFLFNLHHPPSLRNIFTDFLTGLLERFIVLKRLVVAEIKKIEDNAVERVVLVTKV